MLLRTQAEAAYARADAAWAKAHIGHDDAGSEQEDGSEEEWRMLAATYTPHNGSRGRAASAGRGLRVSRRYSGGCS